MGQAEEGDAAYARHIQASTRQPALQQAAAAMLKNELAVAEKLLKTHLLQSPTDVPAIRMLAEVAVRCGRFEDAGHLLRRCLELAPGFAAARYDYAVLLHRRNDPGAALAEIERLLTVDSRSPSYRNLQAVILSRVGEYARSSEVYAQLLQEYPRNAKVWSSGWRGSSRPRRSRVCAAVLRRIDMTSSKCAWSQGPIAVLIIATRRTGSGR